MSAVFVPWVIVWPSAMIPVTPPEGRSISNFLLFESYERTLTVSLEPPILIVVVAPGTNVPTIVSTVNTILYLYTLPPAPEVALRASSATNSCSLPEPGAGRTAIWSGPESVTNTPIELPFVPGVLAAQFQLLFEDSNEWFEHCQDEEPFMSRVLKFKYDKIKLVPSVVHLDGTGRLQTVKKNDNLLFSFF